MLEIGYEHNITLKFTDADNSKDLSNFASVINKCYKESRKVGFRNMFNKAEREFISDILHTLTGQSSSEPIITSEKKTVEE